MLPNCGRITHSKLYTTPVLPFTLSVCLFSSFIRQAPSHLLGNGSDGRTWSSPFRDAVDVITEKLLDRRTIEPVQGFSEEDLIRQKCMQNDIMQNHADYTGKRAVIVVELERGRHVGGLRTGPC